jgi:Flp pilus assembly pilin Flp
MQPCLRVGTARSSGQGVVEYTLIMLFVVLVVMGGLVLLGPQIAHVFGSIHNTL